MTCCFVLCCLMVFVQCRAVVRQASGEDVKNGTYAMGAASCQIVDPMPVNISAENVGECGGWHRTELNSLCLHQRFNTFLARSH